ncbi:MAG: ABC transporter permease [Candidatus Binatia bacterium]|nr:ABC transporter permease [Candidatus Binatia bacterium]
MEPYVFSNLVTAVLVLGLALALWAAGRSFLWRQAGRELVHRRPVALAVVAVYALVAGLDSIAWTDPHGEVAADDTALLGAARTLLDRFFPTDFQEASYSAPLADHELYGGEPLRHPGAHLLGTDIIGRDVLHRALKGARVALIIGGLTSLIVLPLALLVGVSAGYVGGRLDDAVFFLVSTLASMPSLLLLIALIMVLGSGTVQVCVALGVTGWVGLARLVRAETFKIRELDYIDAARVLGTSELRIVWRHVLPNLMHLVVITFALLFSSLVLSEVVLSWLGIGIDGSWGRMIDQSRTELSREPIIWWNLSTASVALFGLILAVNQVADAVRDILDPRTMGERS